MRQTGQSGRPLGFQDQDEQLHYLRSVVLHLEAISGRKLDAGEKLSWTVRLKTYPKWKIERLSEYIGPLNHKVLEFLETTQMPPEYHAPMLEAPKGMSEVGKDVLAHVRRLFAAKTHDEKVRVEREHVLAMRKKYPHLEWHGGMKENANI